MQTRREHRRVPAPALLITPPEAHLVLPPEWPRFDRVIVSDEFLAAERKEENVSAAAEEMEDDVSAVGGVVDSVGDLIAGDVTAASDAAAAVNVPGGSIQQVHTRVGPVLVPPGLLVLLSCCRRRVGDAGFVVPSLCVLWFAWTSPLLCASVRGARACPCDARACPSELWRRLDVASTKPVCELTTTFPRRAVTLGIEGGGGVPAVRVPPPSLRPQPSQAGASGPSCFGRLG